VKLLRHILALLIVTAYLGATVFQVAPVYAASADMSSGSMNGMTHEQHGQGEKMPCKGMLPNCMTDIGCIFLVSVPSSPGLNLFTTTTWSSTDVQPGVPGPFAHPHQFSVALTALAGLRLATPVPLPLRLLRCTSTVPPALLMAMSISSLANSFSVITLQG
jgi:hypothetical protein